jgi:tRNA pseudouridine38-40 synthase
MACCIEYDGSDYHGWQAQQRKVATVQQELERALAAVAGEPLRVHCAGRTDTGVHAVGQIVHFDAPVVRSCKSWVLGTNANLPVDIRVQWAVPVNSEFDARFSARSRRYRYVIANTPVRPALQSRQITWQRRPLDAQAMHSAAQNLLGERDFSAFRAASCQSASAMRNVHFLRVSRSGALIIVDIQANAFLHHMVRNIVGSLMAVGAGTRGVEWISQLLESRDRTAAADTASPHGLYLMEVDYSPDYELPKGSSGPPIVVV